MAALVIGVPFVIFWISKAAEMKAPGFFVFFGLAVLVLLVVNIGMSFYNATSRNRISQYDITTNKEEGDPFDRLAPPPARAEDAGSTSARGARSGEVFCPCCGTRLDQGFKYCPRCGKPQGQPSGS